MKYELNNQTLTIYLEGELNSVSAESAEKEIDALLEKNEFNSLVFDMANLKYMSSAGIRVMMKLRQKYEDLHLYNMPNDVYDIFNMVGLANVFDIKRLK